MSSEESKSTSNIVMNKCGICHEILDDLSIPLKCNHKYHYECIKMWFLTTFTSTHVSNRECPYCRTDGGYLPLRPGEKYIDRLHHPSRKKIKKVIERCKGITVLGKPCKKYANSKYNGFCHLHKA